MRSLLVRLARALAVSTALAATAFPTWNALGASGPGRSRAALQLSSATVRIEVNGTDGEE